MKRTRRLVLSICLTILANLGAQLAIAQVCTPPGESPKIPSGSSASRDQMLQAKRSVQAINNELTTYSECIKRYVDKSARGLSKEESESLSKRAFNSHDAQVARVNSVVDCLNRELRIFKDTGGGSGGGFVSCPGKASPNVQANAAGSTASASLELKRNLVEAIRANDVAGADSITASGKLSTCDGLYDSIFTRNIFMMRHFLERGRPEIAHPDCYRAGFSASALGTAAVIGYLDGVQLLLDKGANVNLVLSPGVSPLSGWTAADHAVVSGNQEVVALIERHGGRRNATPEQLDAERARIEERRADARARQAANARARAPVASHNSSTAMSARESGKHPYPGPGCAPNLSYLSPYLDEELRNSPLVQQSLNADLDSYTRTLADIDRLIVETRIQVDYFQKTFDDAKKCADESGGAAAGTYPRIVGEPDNARGACLKTMQIAADTILVNSAAIEAYECRRRRIQ